jgi:hypothetical protein
MSDGQITALGAVLGALITGLVTALVMLLNAWHKNRQEAAASAHKISQESERSAIEQYREVADRQQKQIERQDAHIQRMQDAVDCLTDEHTHCQVSLTALYGVLDRLYDYAVRVAHCCRRLGEDPGEPPPLPPRPERPARDAEYERRQIAQTTQNLQKLSGVQPPNAGGTAP